MKRASLRLGIALFSALAVPAISAAQEVRVMTRNQYLGTNIAPFLTAATPQEFLARLETGLAQIAATNFPERAQALAREIAEKRPHLVGIQEAYRFALDDGSAGDGTGAPPFRDQLVDLLQALDSYGVTYVVVGEVVNLHLRLPLPGRTIEVTDRLVVLARGDVPAWAVPVPGCRASGDGCNFDFVAAFNSPLGIPIAIERGFLVVDAVVGGRAVRFVNTHLEIPELPLILQSVQAAQLVATLAALPNPSGMPVIVVGDMNSGPTDETVVAGGMTIVPPYQQFAAAGYQDTWLLRPGTPPGFTCCEAEGLLNAESSHVKRIDLIWTSVPPARVRANLLGVHQEDRTPSGLWPSDHAGVSATLQFPQ